MFLLAYLHTIHRTLWISCSSPSSSGLVLREIRSGWLGSFNGVLSRKSRSVAAFIFCHFSNSMCCVCMCMCSMYLVFFFVFAETGCFQKSSHACTSLQFSVGNEFQGAVERNRSCLSAPPPPMSFSLDTDDISLLCFCCFMLVSLYYLDLLTALCFILFQATCCLIRNLRLSLKRAPQFSFQLDFTWLYVTYLTDPLQ